MVTERSESKKLNELDGKEWVKHTKSWFIVNPGPRSKSQLNHPAKFPEQLVKRFLEFFTRKSDWVLDPFAGVASTLKAAKELSRNSVGIELDPEFVTVGEADLSAMDGESEHHLLLGDSMELESVLEDCFKDDVPRFRFLITSPPYYNMLRKSRGGNKSTHKERKEKGYRQFYSDSSFDLGNLESYEQYIEAVGTVVDKTSPFLVQGAYLTVVVQNMRDIDGTLRPIAWDIA